jgi:hypothetical protein
VVPVHPIDLHRDPCFQGARNHPLRDRIFLNFFSANRPRPQDTGIAKNWISGIGAKSGHLAGVYRRSTIAYTVYGL